MIHTIHYKCPNCDRPIKRDILWGEFSVITISTWCPRCEAIHNYEVSIIKKDKEYEIKIKYFLCNGENTTTRPTLIGSKQE
jgi:uncharacterized C2H2 Zn-finger protein